MTASPSVVVAVLTFRRNDDLRAVLPLLDREVETARARGFAADVLVVDNDPAAGGVPVVAEHRRGNPGSTVTAVHEAEPGISAARNRALAESAHREVLVFIDDDERPVEGWLSFLLDTWRRTGAVAVAGPVRSEFPDALDPWIVDGGFFQRRRLRTDAPIDVAATNNLLLHLPPVRAAGLTFDPAFGLSGGGDSLFTRQLGSVGPMVWCAEAMVTDVVPVDRATRDWVLRRVFRFGNASVRIDRLLATGPTGRMRAQAAGACAGGVRVVAGAGRLAWGWISRSRVHRARGMRTMTRGLGMLAGASGHVYAEYAQRSSAAG